MAILKRFSKSVRRSFWRGVATLLPALLTIVVIVYGLTFLHTHVGQHINRGIIWGHEKIFGWDGEVVAELYGNFPLNLAGTIVAVVGICVFGYLLAGFIGVRIWRSVERIVQRVPIVRQIYSPAKQITEFVFSEKKLEFSRVVAVEYPSKGIFSVGFVTGRSFPAINNHVGEHYLTVFVPNSPWPMTGFTICVSRDRIVYLPVSTDEAFRFLISGGVIGPGTSAESLLPEDLLAAEAKARAEGGEAGGQTEESHDPGQKV
ncbi:MAG: DUF502 domain-containing protein [Planctomycetia bacterium]|nr:DUF502 domain-containing protein [Planctomycetia bacterium]